MEVIDIKLVAYPKNNNNNNKCLICNLAYDKNNKQDFVLSKCGHIYHKLCIDPLLKIKNVCPFDNTKWK